MKKHNEPRQSTAPRWCYVLPGLFFLKLRKRVAGGVWGVAIGFIGSYTLSCSQVCGLFSFFLQCEYIISVKEELTVRNPKYHIYLTPDERRTVINSRIDLRNDPLSQDRYTDIIDELIIRLTKARIKRIKVK